MILLAFDFFLSFQLDLSAIMTFVSVTVESKKSNRTCTFQVLLFKNVKMSLINMTKYRNTELSYPLSVCVCQKVISKRQTLICYWLKKLNQSSHWLGQSPKIDAGEGDEGKRGAAHLIVSRS